MWAGITGDGTREATIAHENAGVSSFGESNDPIVIVASGDDVPERTII
ncbi:MAG: hypothetical protein WBX15_11915 [Thermoanaerobaculia bacterium]